MDTALAAPAGARDFLRSECEAVHHRLDSRLTGIDFDDRDAYAAMLSRFSAPLTAFESALEAGAAARLFDDLSERWRARSLLADLHDLNGRFDRRQGAPIEDEAEALGIMYVLEGSRLGGRVLARRAAESADPAVRGATRYFRHAENAGHWRSFLSRLEASEAVRLKPERAKAGALAAFAAFEAALA